MKYFTITILVLLFLLFCFTTNSNIKDNPENDFKKQWEVVDSLENIGQPKAALKLVDEILKQAAIVKADVVVIKAIIYKMKLNSEYKEGAFEENINFLEDYLHKATFPNTAILHSITAEMYWQYLSRNRYKIQNRMIINDIKTEQLNTWDEKMFARKILEHYQASLKNPEKLMLISREKYIYIIKEGKHTDIYRPTLLDFLAHRALSFYTSAHWGFSKSANGFILNQPQLFGPNYVFTSYHFTPIDSFSLALHTIKTYQLLLKLRMKSKNIDALYDVDIDRINYVYRKSVLENKDSLYVNYLTSELNKNKNMPVAVRLAGQLSDYYMTLANRYDYSDTATKQYRYYYLKAAQLCQKYIDKFPQNLFTPHLRNNLIEINKKSLSLKFENIIPVQTPFLVKLNYRNIPQVYGKILSISNADLDDLAANFYGENYFKALIKKAKPITKTVTYNLHLPKDFQSHATELILDGLPVGTYIVMFSGNKDFKYDSTITTYGIFSVSNLSFITQTVEKSYQEIFVINRVTGEPVPNAVVRIWENKYSYKKRRYIKTKVGSYVSDNQGYVKFKSKGNTSYFTFYVDIKTDDDYLPDLNKNYYLSTYHSPKKTYYKVNFFTDRSIYRPGQTVNFKIIATKHIGDKVELAEAKRQYQVELMDVNYQQVGKLNLQLNEFGSASGSFVLPKDGLPGRFTIRTTDGSVNIRVEPYKRPKFFVKFNPVKGNYIINDSITITGKAVSYAGASLSGSTVSYWVVRTPVWTWRYYPWLHCQQTVITTGTITTDAQGNFNFKFKAFPDLSYPKNDKISFNYRVQVDVTDINGETQSAYKTVTAAYTAMKISAYMLNNVDKNDFDTLRINTKNWNNVDVAASGKIEIYSLESPEKYFVERNWKQPDFQYYDEDEWNVKMKKFRYGSDWYLNTAKVKKLIISRKFDTGKSHYYKFKKYFKKMPQGYYMLKILSKDTFDNPVTYTTRFFLFDSESKKTVKGINCRTFLKKSKLHPGEQLHYLVASTPKRKFLYDIEQNGKIIYRKWLTFDNNEQKEFVFPIKEAYRGGITIHLVSVLDNRVFSDKHTIYIPFDNKKLNISFETFRNKLLPGQKETWKIKISGYKKEKIAAEMLAAMYDKSLDDILPHSWHLSVNSNKYYYQKLSWSWAGFSVLSSNTISKMHTVWAQEETPTNDNLNWFNYYFANGYSWSMPSRYESEKGVGKQMLAGMAPSIHSEEIMPDKEEDMMLLETTSDKTMKGEIHDQDAEKNKNRKNEKTIQIRRNFNETAFFYPDLRTDEFGNIIFSFTVPEALTTWKFMGLAHSRDLSYRQITKEIITQKPLMILTNPPRFFREGDKILFPATISNLDKNALSVTVSLKLFDAITNKPLTFEGKDYYIAIKPNESQSVSWEINIPSGIQAITYRIEAKSQIFTDGEEDVRPVLSNRMMITETMPMYINKQGTKQYQFKRLLNSGNSKTISSYHIAVEFTSNPIWYAIQSLPYLMDYPDECSEQLFSRFYANSFATYLINSQPIIKKVFDTWKNLPDSKVFLSNLEKNETLKNIVLSQTPWVQDAANETEQKKRMGVLFDLNKMYYEKDNTLKKLLRMQTPNGGWPWFEGMPDNRYITQYIVEGLGEMQKYGLIDIKSDNKLYHAVNLAIKYLDDRINEDYKNLLKYKANKDADHLYNTIIHYLYVRSLWIDFPINKNNKTAYNYYYTLGEKYWVKKGLYEQGLIAFTYWNKGKKDITRKIIASLKDRCLHSDEFGNYWRQNNFSYYWYNSDIETQSLLIQLFQEVTQDKAFVDNMKIWLLKQKQTRRWKSTKATVAAVNALLSTGRNWLESSETVELKVGKFPIKDVKIAGKQPNLIAVVPEPGSGYFKVNWNKEMITPDMGNVTIIKKDDGVAWGAMYWQYFDDIDKVIPAQAGVSITRKLFKSLRKDNGEVLVPIKNNDLKIGDKVIVRMILKTDRRLEYVHLCDLRASALEPVKQISGYHYREGLGYYQAIKDASTDFFIDNMPKGTYVFEYPLRVTYAGDFSNGFASIQCLYAPEFAAHSKGQRISVMK